MHASESSSPVRPPVRALGLQSILWLLSPLLLPLLHWAAPMLPVAVRAGAGFLCLILLPGWLLQRLIVPFSNVGLVARVTRAFLLGIALTSLLGIVAWFFGGDVALGPVAPPEAPPPFPGRLSAVVWGIGAMLFVGAVLLWLQGRRYRRRAAEGSAEVPEGGSGDEELPAAPAPEEIPLPVPVTPEDPRSPRGRIEREILRQAYRLGEEQKIDRPLAPQWATLLALGSLLLFAGVLAFYAGSSFGYDTDVPSHVACLREMVDTDRILPRTMFHVGGDGASVDPRKGFFHVALAAIAQLAQVDPIALLRVLPGILTIFALIVFHTMARRILRSEGTALLATFLAMVCFGQARSGLLPQLAYGSHMGVVLVWGVLALGLRFVSGDGRRPMLWLVAASAFAATATHLFAAVNILFTLGVFWVALLLLRRWRDPRPRRGGLVLLAALGGCLPMIAWRYFFAAQALNPLHTHSQGLLYLSERLYIINPIEWAPFLGAVGFGGVLLSLLLWRRLDESDGVVYLAALSLAPLLILLNPLVVPLLEPLLGYLIARFAILIPFLVVLAYVARWMGENLLELNSARRVLTAVFFYGLMVLLLFPRLEGFAASYSRAHLDRAEARSMFVWEDLLERLDAEAPESAVVLTDPITGYTIPAMTRHYSVAVLHQHASPADSLAIERLAGVRDVLSPYLGTGEKARICRRFGVDYVLVNATFGRAVDQFFCHVGPARARRQIAALAADPALFEPVWEVAGRGALFAVRKENLDPLSGIVRSGEQLPPHRNTSQLTRDLFMRRLPDDARPVLPDTVAGITLVAAAFDTNWVARGESLGVTLYWRRVGDPAQFPVISHLRLDTPAPRGLLWTPQFSKLHRLWQQVRKDVFYRLRRSIEPLGGSLGVEHWPRDRHVVDHVKVPIHPNCAPGEYVLRVRWGEASFLPNLPLSHYLSDQDAFQGMAVGAVEVY
ncbi:MAG: hypothetical protein KAY32_02025 [Candidatus Eisenbacteria sp.]|nr:hypothetical protein [Candidatus Eisenbacteria bacterium]